MPKDSTYTRRKTKRRAKTADADEIPTRISPPTPTSCRVSSNALTPAYNPGVTPLDNILPPKIKEEPPEFNGYVSDSSTIPNDDRDHISDSELPEEKSVSDRDGTTSAPEFRIKTEPANEDECYANEVKCDHTVVGRSNLLDVKEEVKREVPTSALPIQIKSEPSDNDPKVLERDETTEPQFRLKSEVSYEDESKATRFTTAHRKPFAENEAKCDHTVVGNRLDRNTVDERKIFTSLHMKTKPLDDEVQVLKHDGTSVSAEIVDLTWSDEDSIDDHDEMKRAPISKAPQLSNSNAVIKQEPVDNDESKGGENGILRDKPTSITENAPCNHSASQAGEPDNIHSNAVIKQEPIDDNKISERRESLGEGDNRLAATCASQAGASDNILSNVAIKQEPNDDQKMSERRKGLGEEDNRLKATAADGERFNQYLNIIRATSVKQEPLCEEAKVRNSDQRSLGESINAQDRLIPKIDLMNTDSIHSEVSMKADNVPESESRERASFEKFRTESAANVKKISKTCKNEARDVYNSDSIEIFSTELKYLNVNESITKEEMESALKRFDKCKLEKERPKSLFKIRKMTRKTAKSEKKESTECAEKEQNISSPRPVSVSNVIVPIPQPDHKFRKGIHSPQSPYLFNGLSGSENNLLPQRFSLQPQNVPSPSTSTTYSHPEQFPISTKDLRGILDKLSASQLNLQFSSTNCDKGSGSVNRSFENDVHSSEIPNLSVDDTNAATKRKSSNISEENSKKLKLSTAEYLQKPLAKNLTNPHLSNIAVQKTVNIPGTPSQSQDVHLSDLSNRTNLLGLPSSSSSSTSTMLADDFRNVKAARRMILNSLNLQKHELQNIAPKSIESAWRLPNSNMRSEKGDALGIKPHFVRDPRLAKVVQPIFQGRIGTSLCLSLYPYKNAGKVLLDDEFSIFVLQWNPTWLQVSSNWYPPICDFYSKVESVYKSVLQYYNTYTPLHLLSLWLTFAAEYSRNPIALETICYQVEEGNPGQTKIFCHIILKSTDIRPKREDIVLCKATNSDGSVLEFFGRVTSVLHRACDPPSDCSVHEATWFKFKIEFTCCLAPSVSLKSVRMQIILNLRVALMQNYALQNINKSFRDIVLDPKSNSRRARLVRCEPDADQKLLRDCILQALKDTQSVVLVDTSKLAIESSAISLTVLVAYSLSRLPDVLVLVCTKSKDVLFNLTHRLRPYDPVIAIRSGEIETGDELRPFTMEELLKKGKLSEVYKKKSPITLTLFSSFVPPECKQVLAKHPNVVCIVDGADMCTEAETALPLSLPSVKKLVLTGNPTRFVNGLSEVLQSYRYHLSLFRRLFVAQL